MSAATSGALNPLSAKRPIIVSALMDALPGSKPGLGAAIALSIRPIIVFTVGPRGQETVAWAPAKAIISATPTPDDLARPVNLTAMS